MAKMSNLTNSKTLNTAQLNEVEIVKFNIDLLEKDYSVFEDRSNNYFSHLYSILQFTIVYYGGILVLLNAFSHTGTDIERLTFTLVAYYALPIMTYILGLFYMYNITSLDERKTAINKGSDIPIVSSVQFCPLQRALSSSRRVLAHYFRLIEHSLQRAMH